MDLLKHLIAPYEQQQQQQYPQGTDAFHPTPTQAQPSRATHTHFNGHHALVHPETASHAKSISNMVPVTDQVQYLQGRSLHPEVLNFLAKHAYKPADSLGESVVPDSNQTMQVSSLHPDVLSFLAQQAGPSTGSASTVAGSVQGKHPQVPPVNLGVLSFLKQHGLPVPEAIVQSTHDMPMPELDGPIQYHPPVRVQRPEHPRMAPMAVSFREDSKKSSVSETPQLVSGGPMSNTSVTRKQYLEKSSSNESQHRTICFFWYHFGDCTKYALSPNFIGCSNPCRLLHYIDADMEDVACQKVAGKMHKRIGDCGLHRCPWSGSYDMYKHGKQSAGSSRVQDSESNEMTAEPVKGSAAEQEGALPKAEEATPSASPAKRKRTTQDDEHTSQPTKKRETRERYLLPTPSATPSRKQTRRTSRKKPPMAANLALQQPLRNANLRSASPFCQKRGSNSSEAAKPTTSTQEPKLPKPVRPSPGKPLGSNPASTASTLDPKVLSMIVDPKPSRLPPPTSMPTTQKEDKQTCFFWYHGNCARKGKRCSMLHSLTNPPSFVEPPPGFVHRESCFREWCPGDWVCDRHDDGDEADDGKGGDMAEGKEEKWEGKGLQKMMVVGEEEEEDREVEDWDDEWIVKGFPDA